MRKISLLPIIAAILSSCTLFTGNQNPGTAPSNADIAAFQKTFMSSYYAERGSGTPTGARALTPFSARATSGARTTVPFPSTPYLWANLIGKNTVIVGDYPEPLQTTSFTVTAKGTITSIQWAIGINGGALMTGSWAVYDVMATTTYNAPGDIRKTYVEEYYVADCGVGDDPGTWTNNDPIVTLNGAAATQNQAARLQMVLTFQDGSTRTETIISSSLAGGPKFPASAFNVNGSLDLSQATIPTWTTNPNVMFSSIVQYYVTPSTNPNFWFWTGSNNQTILGIRYYTEVATPPTGSGAYTAYTTSYEKALDNLTTTGGTFTTTLSGVTAGSNFQTLAETVLRQQVVYGLGMSTGSSPYYVPTGTGAPTTNMQTRVVNITGNSTFYLNQMNSDFVSLSVPTASADALLTANPSLNVFTRTESITPSAGILPFAIATTDVSGLGSLGTLVTSITEGTATVSVSGAPTSNVTGAAAEYSFSGQQAIGLSTVSTLDLSSAGTVEAWVYITVYTDTAGIVHNGVKIDFSDEGYSLQGWGASGQIGIILDQKDPNPGESYDYVLSSTNLAVDKWYYVAATWTNPRRKYVSISTAPKTLRGR